MDNIERPNKITVYRKKYTPGWNFHAASPKRDWMQIHTHLYRCLPMTIANQNGWVIESPCNISAIWFGGLDPKTSMHFWVDKEYNVPNPWVKCHFLGGIITFEFNFIIKTTEKTNLLVRGAPNFFIDGLHPLEGLVETDWLSYTFTMNWKVTQPNKLVTFKKGDPICFLQPIPHNYSETFDFTIDHMENNPELKEKSFAWGEDRTKFHEARKLGIETRKWQKDYFNGRDVLTKEVHPEDTHATKLNLVDPIDQKLPRREIIEVIK